MTKSSDATDPKRPGAGRVRAIGDLDYERLTRLVQSEFGIALGLDKQGLVVSRLAKVLEKHDLASFGEYCDAVENPRNRHLLSELVDRMSTNHTHFQREAAHFDFLSKVALPEAIERQRSRASRDLRVWCAAASTGEEPYTLAMLILEALGDEAAAWRAGVLATDISSETLEQARIGRFRSENVQRLPASLRNKYFLAVDDEFHEAIPRLRREVVLRRFNLMNTLLPFKGEFDVVFCRNVMIYFTPETTAALVQRIHRAIAPGGYFFVGLSEALDRATSPFEYIAPGIHRKSSAVAVTQ